MRQTCANTATLTLNSDTLASCQCILEEKRLRAQFAGIDLPIQCFTTVCNIENTDVYKTAEQVSGCSARICSQTLSVHGNDIMAQGFQQIICNGEVFTLNTFGAASPVPLVSQADQEAPPGPELGPVFYVAVALLVVMLVLMVVWGIRRFRAVRRIHKQQRQDIEMKLLQVIK